ncbi:MAG TPA: CBS domain-containing protein [Chitinophagaceae bacterium]
MLNKELISSSLPVLSPADTVLHAQQLLADYHLFQLPVVSEGKYLGLITEDDILNAADENLRIIQLENRFSKVATHANNHFVESVQLCNDYGLSVVPVVDKDMDWVGVISAPDLLRHLGKMTGTDEPGGLIVLELNKADFSFSEISKLVETNDAQITQLNTFFDTQQQLLHVTIKVNKFEISDIVATFQRYEYTVKYYFGEELYENELRSNYDHLMNYLNM